MPRRMRVLHDSEYDKVLKIILSTGVGAMRPGIFVLSTVAIVQLRGFDRIKMLASKK